MFTERLKVIRTADDMIQIWWCDRLMFEATISEWSKALSGPTQKRR